MEKQSRLDDHYTINDALPVYGRAKGSRLFPNILRDNDKSYGTEYGISKRV